MRKSVAALAFLIVFAFLLLGMSQLRPFGEPENTEMDDYFLYDQEEGSQAHNQVNNIVTAILFDYRGLDTLGEATVLFSAVSGVVTVLRKVKKSGKEVQG